MDIDSGIQLISLDELKEYLGVSGSEEDAILKALLNAASSWVQSYLGRNLRQAAHLEYYDGSGGKKLILKNRPVLSVTSVHIDANRQWASSSEVDVDTNIIVRKREGILQAWNLFGSFPCGEANVRVVYTSGYSIGHNDTEAAGGMPQTIRMAVKRLVDLHYRTGYTNRKLDIRSESVGEVNTTFNGGTLPDDVKQLLAPHLEYLGAPNFVYEEVDASVTTEVPYIDLVQGTSFPEARAGRIFFHITEGQFYASKDGSTWSILG